MPIGQRHLEIDRALPVVAALLLMAVGLAGAPSDGRTLDDPSIDYRTLQTPHFYVHYNAELEALARRSAAISEEAYRLLVPLLENAPDDRTHIVIDDKRDTANGSASPYGRKTIRILGMPPEPSSSLGYYEDWLRILIYHEYAHILHLTTDGGLPGFVNQVLGSVYYPNSVMPRWYVEGLAVMYESDLTGTGRNNSSFFRMYLREATLDDNLFSLATTSNFPSEWPYGTTAYLYGGSFMEYIAKRHGREFATEYNHLYGRQIVPFALNYTLAEITGATFHELYQEWTTYIRARALATHVAVRAGGQTKPEYITDTGGIHRFPRARPGTDQVSFYTSPLNSHARFAVTSTDSEQKATLFEVEGANGTASWTPDGEALVYSRLAVEDNVYAYNDLFLWNAETGDSQRLTEGWRARDPAVSPDGSRIAFVRNRPGTNDLVACRFQFRTLADCRTLVGRSPKKAWQASDWRQIATPVWTNDGEALIFSMWRADVGHRDLWTYDFTAPEGERLARLTDDPAQDTAPHVGPGGIVWWSSDRTRIFNVYAHNPETGETWQVTNVDSGLFQPWVSPNGRWIYVSAYTADGWELARFPRPSRFRRQAPDSYPERPHPSYPEVDTEDWEDSDYNALHWLTESMGFSPNFGVVTRGAGVGATISGDDPFGHHEWSLSGALLTTPEFVDLRGNLALQYRWTGGPLNVETALSLQETPRQRGLFAESRFVPFVERQYAGELGLQYPIRAVGDFLAVGTELRLEYSTFRDHPAIEPDPFDRQPREPRLGWFNELSLTLTYSNLDRYANSVSIERGISGRLAMNIMDEAIGSEFNSTFLTYALRLYHPNPIWDRHVFNLRLDGGIARAEFRRDRAFAVGGYVPQDVLADMIFQRPRGQFVLRGYPPGLLVGSQFQVWTGAYRFPILRLDEGLSTVPAFVRRLNGQIFVDTGGAFDGLLADADLRTSIGGELQLGTQFGYYLRGTLKLGFARGLGEDGISEWYVLYGNGF
ncbi:MAG: hypothetical protein ABEN55_05900 [Bradymonadaceae bacterium]